MPGTTIPEPKTLPRLWVRHSRLPSPSAIEEFLFYDHPSVENRIRMAMEWKAAHPPSGGTPRPAR